VLRAGEKERREKKRTRIGREKVKEESRVERWRGG
jgi:hypothetical protein